MSEISGESIGILSSGLPTPCGLATFTQALGSALARRGCDVGVVRVLDTADGTRGTGLPVVAELVADQPATIARAVDALNERDGVIIQHEFGLYGGPDGEDVIKVMAALNVPTVAVMHTVLRHPTPHQREVADEVLGLCQRAVVMTDVAETVLVETFDVDPDKVVRIPHGAHVLDVPPPRLGDGRPLLLTWGLIGPGKGIERVLDALMALTDLDPPPLYLVAGRTHPKVFAHSGNAYRDGLAARAELNGVRDLVAFDDSYRPLESLEQLIASATSVVMPYDSAEQATSGVLVDAIAAGRPVIATAFPHAIEMLSTGAGIVVPHHDIAALAEALRRTLTEPTLLASMAAEARELAPLLSWDTVAGQYLSLLAPVEQSVGSGS